MLKAARFIPGLYSSYSSQVSKIPLRFSWLVEGKLAALARPKSQSDFKFLKDNGVTHLVSLTEKVPDYHGVELTSVHMPIEEEGMPTLQQAKQFTHIVTDVNSQGGAVALHCEEGQGRTGTLLACYTVWANKITAEQAIKEIREKRPGSVGGKQSREVRVKEFETMLHNNHMSPQE